jgi:hypothetical protein
MVDQTSLERYVLNFADEKEVRVLFLGVSLKHADRVRCRSALAPASKLFCLLA